MTDHEQEQIDRLCMKVDSLSDTVSHLSGTIETEHLHTRNQLHGLFEKAASASVKCASAHATLDARLDSLESRRGITSPDSTAKLKLFGIAEIAGMKSHHVLMLAFMLICIGGMAWIMLKLQGVI